MNLLVFHNNGCHVLDPFLKEGFKHVFCAINDGHFWITVDGRAGLPVIKVVAGTDYDLAQFYRSEGYTVVGVDKGTPIRVPCVLSNCVGMVKSVLGISASFIVTPYQLYKRSLRHEVLP